LSHFESKLSSSIDFLKLVALETELGMFLNNEPHRGSVEAYLMPGLETVAPQFEVCFDLDAWLHVPTALAPPCCQLPGMAAHGKFAACAQTGDMQGILKPALLSGSQLYVDQITQLLDFLHIPKPGPTEGSGQGGRVKKIDLAEALVRGVFHDGELPEEKLKEIIAGIGGEKQPSDKIPEDTNEVTLRLISSLEPKEKEVFDPIIKEACEALETQIKRHRRKQDLEEKLKATGAEAGMKPGGDAGLKLAQEKPAGASLGIRMSGPRARAPEQFVTLLPPCKTLYFHWEHNRCGAEFKQLSSGHQRTKTKKFDRDCSLNSKLDSLCVVFEYIHATYHRNFKEAADYDPEWKPHLSHYLDLFSFSVFLLWSMILFAGSQPPPSALKASRWSFLVRVIGGR